MEFGLISFWPRQHWNFFFGFSLIFFKLFFVGRLTLGHSSLGKKIGFNHAFNLLTGPVISPFLFSPSFFLFIFLFSF